MPLFLNFIDLEFNWAKVWVFSEFIIIKIGKINIVYIRKYTIVWIGIDILIRASIHPIWVMDEYAIIVRKWVWFIPIIPPVIAFIPANIIIRGAGILVNTNVIIDRGASFCHVDRIIAGNQLIEVITEGYHKWHGAIPILIINENNRIVIILVINWLDNHIQVLLKISRLDPIAWVNKYLTAASVSW